MKNVQKAAAFMAALGLTSMLFAQQAPKSLKKTATNDLFEDELVDNFDVGVDGAKGLWFGGYNAYGKNFTMGYGNYFGNFWFSVYDEMGNFSFDKQNKTQIDTDAYAQDGITVDYTDSTTTETSKDVNTRNINNNLYIAGAINKVGAQLYWNVVDTTSNSNSKETKTEYDPVTDEHKTTVNNTNAYKAVNNFIVYLNGIKTAEIGNLKFYAELKDIGLEWNANRSKKVESSKTTYGESSLYGTTNTEKTTLTRSGDYLKPRIAYNLGFALPELGLAQNKFSMYGYFNYKIPLNKSKSEEKTVTTNADAVTTTTTKTVTDANVRGAWENCITPKITSSYNFGDKLTAKTAFSAEVKTSGSKNAIAAIKETTTDVETKNVAKTTTTKTHTKESVIDGNYNYDISTVTTTVTPNAVLGLNYVVKQNACDIYIGTKWNAGTLTFEHKTEKEASVVTSKKSTSTDEYGVETVTEDKTTLTVKDNGGTIGDGKNGSGKSEYRSFDFKGSDPSADLIWFGTKLYLAENMQMDVVYKAGVGSISLMGASDGILTSSLAVTFAIKF